jgi:hypothetical protein
MNSTERAIVGINRVLFAIVRELLHQPEFWQSSGFKTAVLDWLYTWHDNPRDLKTDIEAIGLKEFYEDF